MSEDPSPRSFVPYDKGRSDSGATSRDGSPAQRMGHIRLASPSPAGSDRPQIRRGQSNRSISEALRLAQSQQEQEELLGEEEQADDDGCFPPRQTDEPQQPNPHSDLPVYTSIHRIRRLVMACIGQSCSSRVHVRA